MMRLADSDYGVVMVSRCHGLARNFQLIAVCFTRIEAEEVCLCENEDPWTGVDFAEVPSAEIWNCSHLEGSSNQPEETVLPFDWKILKCGESWFLVTPRL